MNTTFNLIIRFLTLTALMCLISCAEPGLVIKNGPAGPNTSDMLNPLPDGLIADKNNARHGSDDLKPTIN